MSSERALIVVIEGVDDDPDNRKRAAVYELDLDTPAGREVRSILRHNPPEKWDGDAATVRRWAQRHNLPVSPRGRIPDEIAKRFRGDSEDDDEIDEERES